MTRPKKYLLVSRIGRDSLHDNWLSPDQTRDFDVVLSSFDANLSPVKCAGVTFEHRPGRKVQGYDGFLREREDLWRGYDYICLMDEDIHADARSLNRMFALSAAHDLKIAQPALSHDSYFTYAGLLQQPQWTLRYVNYVEMMCPVFRCDVLATVAPLFSAGYESGIDLIWCNAVFEAETDFAVLDSVPVRHTLPVGGNKEVNGFVGGKVYEDDIHAVLVQYDLPWFACIPYAAIDSAGHRVTEPRRLKAAALRLFPAVFRQRQVTWRLRNWLVHLKHLQDRIGRPVENNRKISLSTGGGPPSVDR